MTSLILKVLLTLFCVQVFAKFWIFFLIKYDTRRKLLDKEYTGKTSATTVSDNVMLVVLALLVSLLFVSDKMEYLSFITGLYVGATLIQNYFHRFSTPLSVDKTPEQPVSPIKMMSYAIQASPEKPWLELVFLSLLFLWGFFMLLSKGFGLF